MERLKQADGKKQVKEGPVWTGPVLTLSQEAVTLKGRTDKWWESAFRKTIRTAFVRGKGVFYFNTQQCSDNIKSVQLAEDRCLHYILFGYRTHPSPGKACQVLHQTSMYC